MKRRTMAGIAILTAWGGGVGVLVQREYFRPRLERLAEAATRVAPATMYYAAMQGDRQVGFASSTIDTANTSVTENDYFVVELPSGGGTTMRRATARTNVSLSRALRLSRFDLSFETDSAPMQMSGRVDGDSVLLVHSSSRPKSDTTRVPITEPLLLPTLVPLVVGLAERPSVGKRYVLPVFDPTTQASRSVGYSIRAESLFVLSDSAVLDTTASPPVWRGAHPDTVRAWEVTPDSGVAIGFAGWIDEQGRIVSTSQLGFELRRQPYELAFRNWQNDPTLHASDAAHVIGTTALAAGRVPKTRVDSLIVHLYNFDPNLRLRLNGSGQRAYRDTVFAATADDSMLASAAILGPPSKAGIGPTAAAISGGSVEPEVVTKRLLAWVHDSIRPRASFGFPTVPQILRTRTGDCNELAQLFVALARARGLSARPVTGLLYVDGKFYYHAWAEVLLKDWVPVDPMLGQAPADAAHIRLMQGLALRTDLMRRWAGLDVDVVSVKESPRKRSEMSHR
jgi:hypothetical protein